MASVTRGLHICRRLRTGCVPASRSTIRASIEISTARLPRPVALCLMRRATDRVQLPPWDHAAHCPRADEKREPAQYCTWAVAHRTTPQPALRLVALMIHSRIARRPGTVRMGTPDFPNILRVHSGACRHALGSKGLREVYAGVDTDDSPIIYPPTTVWRCC